MSTAPTFTRQQLYDLVWSTPIATLARDLGISSPGLAKLCRRHQIPHPPRGHWSKLRHGKEVHQPELPKQAEEQPIRIAPTPAPTPRTVAPSCAPLSPAIVVEAELRNPHPLIQAHQAALRPRRSGKDGNDRVDWANVLDLHCTAASLDRALRILDALIKAIEARGGRVAVEKHHRDWVTTAALGGDPVPISMREKYDQKPNPEYGKKGDWQSTHYKYIQTPSGRLELRIGEYSFPGSQKSRADGKKLKLEDRLGAIIEEIAQASVAERDRRLSWAESRRQDEQRARERAEREERERRLEAELAGLLKLVDAWRKSRDIRSLVRAIVRRSAELGVSLEPGSPTLDWIGWARSHADRVDPLLAAARQGAAQ
jgi:hypothetical protein